MTRRVVVELEQVRKATVVVAALDGETVMEAGERTAREIGADREWRGWSDGPVERLSARELGLDCKAVLPRKSNRAEPVAICATHHTTFPEGSDRCENALRLDSYDQ